MNLQLRYLLLSCIILLLQTQPSYPFASWLVDREASCYVEVRGDKEVVMNEFIKSVTDSSHPDQVYIQIIDSITGEEVKLQQQQKQDDGRILIPLENNDEHEMIYKYTLRLISPDDLLDLQYIMDALPLPDLWGEELEQAHFGERMSGTFTSRHSGCENHTRDYGRRNDEGVPFEIRIPPTSTWKNQEEQIVDVVAGWACGHTAVTLTHSVQFISKLHGITLPGEDKHVQDKELKDVVRNEEEMAPPDELTNIDVKDHDDHPQVVLEENVKIDDEDDVVDPGAMAPNDDEENNGKSNDGKSLRRNDVPNSSDSKVQTLKRQRKKEPPVSAIRRFKRKYDAKGFGWAKFSTKFYVYGLCTMALLSYLSIKCLILMKRRSSKGRREL